MCKIQFLRWFQLCVMRMANSYKLIFNVLVSTMKQINSFWRLFSNTLLTQSKKMWQGWKNIYLEEATFQIICHRWSTHFSQKKYIEIFSESYYFVCFWKIMAPNSKVYSKSVIFHLINFQKQRNEATISHCFPLKWLPFKKFFVINSVFFLLPYVNKILLVFD